jgi:hypothetical protein
MTAAPITFYDLPRDPEAVVGMALASPDAARQIIAAYAGELARIRAAKAEAAALIEGNPTTSPAVEEPPERPAGARPVSERDSAAVVAAALADPELIRQLIHSLEEELRGIPAVPFRIVQAEARRRDRDGGRVRTSA